MIATANTALREGLSTWLTGDQVGLAQCHYCSPYELVIDITRVDESAVDSAQEAARAAGVTVDVVVNRDARTTYLRFYDKATHDQTRDLGRSTDRFKFAWEDNSPRRATSITRVGNGNGNGGGSNGGSATTKLLTQNDRIQSSILGLCSLVGELAKHTPMTTEMLEQIQGCTNEIKDDLDVVIHRNTWLSPRLLQCAGLSAAVSAVVSWAVVLALRGR